MKILKRLSERISDDAVAHRIAQNIISWQRGLADFLNAKTAKLNRRAMLMILIVFTTLFGSYCMYLIIQACK